MGIHKEFNPDLALRAYGTRGRHYKECLPRILKAGGIYPFLKSGSRDYWLEGAIPLYQTEGKGKFSRPLAAISIFEATQTLDEERTLWTLGRYGIHAVFDLRDETIHFEGLEWVR